MQKRRALNSSKIIVRLFTVLLLAMLMCVITYAAIFEGNGIYFEIDKNPIERVNVITKDDLTVRCGEGASLDVEVYPKSARATIVEKSYYIVDGIKYGSIVENKLIVSGDAPVGSQIKVVAFVDGVESENYLTFTVEATPVEGIEFTNEENSITIGGALKINTKVFPLDATNKQVTYSIVSDTSYMQISYSGTLSFTRMVSLSDDSSVTVRATSVSNPDIYEEKTFSILVPALETVDATKELSEVNQRRAYSFKTSLPYLNEIFGNKAIKYSINVPQDVATIDDVNGLLYILPKAPIDTEITVTIESVDNEITYQQKLVVAKVYATEFAPVVETEPSVNFMNKNYYLPGDEISFDVVSYLPINVTDCNKVFSLKVSDESLAYVDGNKVIIRDKNSITVKNPKLTVTVFSEPNNLEAYFDIDIFIPLESINVIKNDVAVIENTSYKVTDLIKYEVVPQNATYVDYQYKLTEIEESIVRLKNGVAFIGDELPEGELTFSLYVEINGIKSNEVEFNIYKPAHSLEIEATVNDKAIDESNLPVSSRASGDTIIFVTTIDKTASVNKSTVVITKGSDYIDGEIALIKTDDRYAYWAIKLKSNLSQYEGFDKLIKAYATQDGVQSSEISIEIYIPNEDFSLTGAAVDRGSNVVLSPIQTPNATNQKWEFEITAEAQALGVSKVSSDTFFIPKNLPADTKISIKYRLTPSGFYTENCEYKEIAFTVKSIIDASSKTVFNGQVLTNGINFVIGKDSNGIFISSDKKQLWADRYTDINVIFNSEAISAYGLTVDSVTITGSGVEVVNERKDSSFRIHMNSVPTRGDKLSITVSIKDGGNIISYNVGELNAFIPLTGGLTFNQMTKNNTNIVDLINYTSYVGFRFDATYGVGDMKFELLSASGISMNSAGVITVKDYAASSSQTVRYTCQQTYNGEVISYSNTSTVSLKTITIDKNGGTGGYSSIIAVSGMKGIKGSISSVRPSKRTYEFAGFGGYISASGEVLKEYNGQSKLTASWTDVLKTSSTVVLSADNGKRDKTVTDSDGIDESINPGLSKEDLKYRGYKYLYVTITFDCKEKDDGYQDLWIYSYNDTQLHHFEFEHGKGKKDTSWWSHSVSFYIAIDDTNASGTFNLEWGANGNFSDTWYLGYTTVSVTAKTSKS